MHAFVHGLPGRNTIGVYLDWRTQEVGVAAALSEDQALMDAYRVGDVYHPLAVVCGFTDDPDPVHWKNNNQEMRNRIKRLRRTGHWRRHGSAAPQWRAYRDKRPVAKRMWVTMMKTLQLAYDAKLPVGLRDPPWTGPSSRASDDGLPTDLRLWPDHPSQSNVAEPLNNKQNSAGAW
jgi:hypothetical protein